jgi:hypothetical protein
MVAEPRRSSAPKTRFRRGLGRGLAWRGDERIRVRRDAVESVNRRRADLDSADRTEFRLLGSEAHSVALNHRPGAFPWKRQSDAGICLLLQYRARSSSLTLFYERQ